MGWLDSNGLKKVWNNVKAALAKKQDKLTGTAGQVVGFDAAGNAAAQNGDFADKEYVDGLVDAVRADMLKAIGKIACLVIKRGPGESRINLNLVPVSISGLDCSLTYSGDIPYDASGSFVLEPPPGYAFTGLASTWQPALKIGTEYRTGTLGNDGSISFPLQSSDINKSFTFVSMNSKGAPARLMLEVA